MKILPKLQPQHIGELNLEKREGSGSASKLDPEPRTTTYLNRKLRVAA